MATPSSSATSPSPPMAYLSHTPGHQQTSMVTSQNEIEREQRKKAVQKFLARAEISMVTRALRARLSYASYKATHNIPHVALRDLETQSQNQSQSASFNRTIAAKRKAAGSNNYYNNPTTQGSGSASAGSHRRGGSGAMAPPMSGSPPRAYYSSIHGAPSYSGYNEVASGSRNAATAPNLYSSILAPPPTKQARTIHNPSDPPIPAPVRPTTPKPRVSKSSAHDGNHPQPKARHSNKTSKAPASPNRRKNKRASVDKGKRKQNSGDMDVDGDIDMKAAATLTSLFMHHRPSIAGSASSPRSSIDGSEVSSVYSLSHFAQSSARTISVGNPTAPVSAASSSTTIVVDPVARPQTPPSGSQVQHTTPRAAPSDTEAADLMLFLATSPSPARPANKDVRDMAAYRALGGGSGPLRSKGRVLFPSTSTTDLFPGREDVPAATAVFLVSVPTLETELTVTLREHPLRLLTCLVLNRLNSYLQLHFHFHCCPQPRPVRPEEENRSQVLKPSSSGLQVEVAIPYRLISISMSSSTLRLRLHVDLLKVTVVAQVTSLTWVFVLTLEGNSSKKSKCVTPISIPYKLLLLLLLGVLGTGRKTIHLVPALTWSRVEIASSAPLVEAFSLSQRHQTRLTTIDFFFSSLKHTPSGSQNKPIFFFCTN